MLCEGIITSPGERHDINFKVQECDMITGNETNNGGRDFYRKDIPHSILTRSKSTPLLTFFLNIASARSTFQHFYRSNRYKRCCHTCSVRKQNPVVHPRVGDHR